MQEDPTDPGWRYTAALQLLNQAEGSTWSRLTGFLTVSGFIFTAWGLSLSAQPKFETPRISLAVAGLALALFYLFVMLRSRTFVSIYVEYARQLEQGLGPLSHGAQQTALAREATGSERERYISKLFGSAQAAPLVPMIIAAAFGVLLVLSLREL